MAGFLDPKERVIDMVLTDTGKMLLMKGELRFVYWVPFDDEVDYSPPDPLLTTSLGQTQDERRTELTESPLIREATMGYRGLNLVEEDNTNVHRPMYTAPPGVGHTSPLPQMVVDIGSGSVDITIEQRKLTKTYVEKDQDGKIVGGQIGPFQIGVQRGHASSVDLLARYSTGSYTPDHGLEGFLLTIYQSSSYVAKEIMCGSFSISGSGGFKEVLHNRDSAGNIVYLNDLKVKVYQP
jgi:hypothetical protein